MTLTEVIARTMLFGYTAEIDGGAKCVDFYLNGVWLYVMPLL